MRRRSRTALLAHDDLQDFSLAKEERAFHPGTFSARAPTTTALRPARFDHVRAGDWHDVGLDPFKGREHDERFVHEQATCELELKPRWKSGRTPLKAEFWTPKGRAIRIFF